MSDEQRFFRVDIERISTAQMWVEAGSAEEAEEAARELVLDEEFDIEDEHVAADERSAVPSGFSYWSGGVDGGFKRA